MYNRPISYSRHAHDIDHDLQTTQHSETYADFRNHLLAHHNKSISDAERWTYLCSSLSNSRPSDSDIDFVSIQFKATYNPTRIFDKLKEYKYIVYSVAKDEHVAIVFLSEPISQEQKPDFESWFRSRGRLERDQVVFDAVQLPDGEYMKELSGQPLGNLIPVHEFLEHQAYIDKRLCEEVDARLSQADLDVAISKPSKRPSLRNKKQFQKDLDVQRIDFDQNNQPIPSEHTTCWSDITEILWNHAEKRIAADQRWTAFSPVEDIWCFLTFVFPSVHQPSDIIKMFNGHEFCIYSIKDSNKSLKTFDHAVVLPLEGAVSQELKQTFIDTLVKQKGISNDVVLSVLEMPSDHGSFFEHHQGKPISVLDIMLEYRDSQVTDVKNIVQELNEDLNHHLFYVDAPVSARKTFSAVLYALEQARSGRKTVIAQPSVACVKEWFLKANMLAGNIPVKQFHQECCAENDVRGELMRYLKQPSKVGEVILVTQQCLFGLMHFHHASDWDLIVDEIPSVDDKIEIKLPKHFPMITDLIEVKSTGAETSVVQAKDQASESILKGYAENTGDDAVANVFQEIARSLLSKHHVVEVHNQNYHRTIEGDTKDKNGETIPLVFFIRMMPTIFDEFRTTTIMGAVFNYSLLSQLWTNELVEFTEHKGITRGLSFSEAENGNRLVIKVLNAEEGYSKTLGRKEQIIDGEVVTNKEVMLNAIKYEFGDEPFAYLVNKDTEKLAKSIFKDTKGERLPYNPHGLNGFSGYHNVAIMASFRAQPLRQNYLNNNQIDSNMVLDGEQHSLIYQAIGRTSLRNQNREEIVTAIVTDIAVGRFIQVQWPGSKLINMDGVSLAARGKSGPKRKHLNNAKKQEAARERARLKSKLQFKQDSHIRFFEGAAKAINDHSLGDSLNDSGVPEKYHQNLLRITNKSLIGNSIRKNVVFFDNYNFDREIIGFSELEQHDFVGTLLDAKNDPDVSNLMMADSFDEFVDQLREDHKKILQSKSDNLLVSPALYDPELVDDHVRSLDNIVFANNIWIDVDEGQMTTTAFRRMFPEFKMALFNTYSSLDNTRFRAVIQTDSYMTKEQYRSITKQIMQVVKHEEYVTKQAKRKGSEKPCHGIDTSKLHPVSLFYLPSQAEAGPAASFFEYQDGKPIPVTEWCLNSIEQPEQEPNYREYAYDNPTERRGDENEARDILQTKLDKIGTSCESERNDVLYHGSLNVFSLVKKGLLPDHEARQLLHAAAVSTGLDSRSVYSTIKSARDRSSGEYPVLKSEHQRNNSGV